MELSNIKQIATQMKILLQILNSATKENFAKRETKGDRG